MGNLSFLPNECQTLFWNVCGLNDPDKHRPFVSWINSQQSLFGALLKTHIKKLSLTHIMSSLCPRWNFASNHQSDDDGRVIIIWRNPLIVSIISQSRQQVTCEIKIPGLQAIIFTTIYAANTSQDRTYLLDRINPSSLSLRP